MNELFGYSFETEKNKMIKLLQTYSLNIKNNTFKDFQKDIKKKHIRRLFNQPISYNFKELIYYSCNLDLYNDICDNTKKDEKNLTAKRGIIEEIFKQKIFEKYEEFVILIPLVYFICHPEEKENIDFFLNMIESKSLTIDKVKQNYSVIFDNKTKKLLLINGEEAFNEPKELCLENLNNSKYKKYEKYNFEYLIKNPPLKLNINKINKHLEVTLKSNVFKELYIYLTGNDNYQTIFSDEMINDFINKIIYLPVNFCKTASFHDCFSLTTFIFTMKKEISSNFVKYNDNISFILENGVIVAIIFHEFGHSINAVISFIENRLKLNETPRKKYLKIMEGGYYLELLLFGRVIKNLTLGEALYILNTKNYQKSLDDFRNGFMKLSYKDMIIEGQFSNLNFGDEKTIEKLKDIISIKTKKEGDTNDALKNINISIPLRNDIIGRYISEEDLEPFL